MNKVLWRIDFIVLLKNKLNKGEEHCKNISSYKGKDGEKYPKFTVEEINTL